MSNDNHPDKSGTIFVLTCQHSNRSTMQLAKTSTSCESDVVSQLCIATVPWIQQIYVYIIVGNHSQVFVCLTLSAIQPLNLFRLFARFP
jgi:hypothetical protein